MKQVLVKSGKVYVEEAPCPAVSRGMALVDVSHSLISSGTESGFVSDGGAAGFLLKKARDPLNVEKVKRKLASVGVKATLDLVRSKLLQFQAPGYSSAGMILECGEGLRHLRAGDRVACAGVGYASHAEYNLVPEQLLTPIPDGVEYDEAAFVSLGAIAMQGVRQAQTTFGETVVVLGLGLLGQLAFQILRAAGCRVICSDPVPEKRALAAELGADFTCTPDTLADAVHELTGGHGADAVLICAAAKTSAVTRQACDVCRQKGRVVVVGAVGLELEREPLYMKELDFRLSCSYGPGRYNPNYEEGGLDYPIGYVRWTEGRNMAEFLRMIAEKKVQVRPLISLERPVELAAEAYEAVLAGDGATIAALISYGTPKAHVPARTFSCVRLGVPRDSVGVAVIGAGGFAQAQHLPNLKRIPDAHLEAVVAQQGSKAKQVAERFGAAQAATDYREVLQDPRVQAVIIATRHHLHTEMTLAALAAGKHVFVEKPLALTVADAEAICQKVEETGLLLTVGFNRRFSVYAQRAKAALEKMPGPLNIVYRCNAGHLPANHWTLDPEQGGGRILGEAVHFFDICCWLAGGDPVTVRAEMLGPPGTAMPDDLSAVLRFANGSLATVSYTTQGHAGLAKERLECFARGTALVIEDFRGIQFFGGGEKSAKPGKEDKGQRALLENFIDAVRGKTSLEITAADGLRATRIACQALAAARASAGSPL